MIQQGKCVAQEGWLRELKTQPKSSKTIKNKIKDINSLK